MIKFLFATSVLGCWYKSIKDVLLNPDAHARSAKNELLSC